MYLVVLLRCSTKHFVSHIIVFMAYKNSCTALVNFKEFFQ